MCEKGKKMQPFPGSDLFTPEQVEDLSTVLKNIRNKELRAVRFICKREKITSPSDMAVREMHVKLVYGGLMALETARLLGQDLPDDELPGLVVDQSTYEVYPYEEIPQRVHRHFAEREAVSRCLDVNPGM